VLTREATDGVFRTLRSFLLPMLLALLAGSALSCVTNPVTGETEFSLVSEAQELSIGQEQYLPTRQAQGGDYVLDPQLAAYVDRVGQRVAAVSDRRLPYEFAVLNSSVPNAWALPGGKIAINRGLLTELENEAQLAAVLGHEVVHAAARHTARAISRQQLLGAAVIAGSIGVGISTEDGRYAGLTALAGGLGAQLIGQKYGRDAELESDLYGTRYMAEAGYDPRAAVELQEIFVRLSGGRNPGWLEGLFASHPPSQERVEKNRGTAARLLAERDASTLELGAATYRQRMAGLLATREAYEAYDAGRKAFAGEDLAEAERLARQAIAGEPREGRFHGLLGDVALSREKKQEAAAHYGRAIELDGARFFRPLVLRGLVRKEQGDAAGSRADLQRSMELLPTEAAQAALTELGG